MSRTSEATALWDTLRQDLTGSFTARARGLFATAFALLGPNGEEFGRLRLRDATEAEFRSGDYVATFEPSKRRYRMVTGGTELLVAAPKGRSIDELVISCGDQTYETHFSFFRNSAVASYPGGERAARLSGGFTGRSYEALFADEDSYALLVVIFLLWHIAANRRRAYVRGA